MKTENIGWQCPNCLVVYAPSVINCLCSSLPKEPTVAASGFGTTITGIGAGTTICSGFISQGPNDICSKCGKTAWNHHNISST